MKKTILIIFTTLLFIISCTGCGVSQQKQEELVNILFEQSETNNGYYDEMLAGSGEFGELYMKVKDTEEFHEIVYDKYNELLNQYSDMESYEYIEKKTYVLKNEGLFTPEVETLFSEHQDNIAKKYSEYITQELADKEYEEVAKDLAWLVKEDLLEKSGCDINAVLDELVKNCSIYSLETGKGAFYDFAELRDSSSSMGLGVDWMPPIGYRHSSYKELAYGDFCVGESYSSTHYEGLEGSYLAGKYNTSSSSLTVYLRGKETNGYGWADTLAWTSDHGAKYIICHETINKNNRLEVDCILMIGEDALYPMTYYGENGYAKDSSGVSIKGDFSQTLKQIEQVYDEKYSTVVEINNAIDCMRNEKYKEALDVLKYYTHLEVCEDYVYTMAVESIKNGQQELGFEALRYVEMYSSIGGINIEDTLASLEGNFDGDVKYKNDKYQLFLRLMMDVFDPMDNAQIKETLSGKYFKDIPDYTKAFKADGTGYSQKAFSSTNHFKWYAKDNKLYIEYKGNGEPRVYTVYNIYDQYYLLTSTTSYSSNVYMTLLKEK